MAGYPSVSRQGALRRQPVTKPMLRFSTASSTPAQPLGGGGLQALIKTIDAESSGSLFTAYKERDANSASGPAALSGRLRGTTIAITWPGSEAERIEVLMPSTSSGVQYTEVLLPNPGTESSGTDFRLIPRPAGSISSLAPEPAPEAQPGQVSVKVQAVGLNFRDLLVVSEIVI